MGKSSTAVSLALSRPGPRGERTRTSLVAAARHVFERDGFGSARITDIAAAAGAAVGSFYTYFDSKDAVFRAIMQEVSEEFTRPLPSSVGSDPLARIEAGNRAYVRSYRKHARILVVMQHRTFEDPELYAMRQRDLSIFVERAERAIRRLQESGRIPRTTTARFAAQALCGMVHAFCYETFAFGAQDAVDLDEEEVVFGLASLWSQALGIEPVKAKATTKPTTNAKKAFAREKGRDS